MTKVQGTGMLERTLYAVFFYFAMKFVAWGYIDPSMAEYVAAGGVLFVGNAYGWWVNRPSSLLADAKSSNPPSAMMTAAAETLPKNTGLVITTTSGASPVEKADAHAIADAASDKVVAKTTA